MKSRSSKNEGHGMKGRMAMESEWEDKEEYRSGGTDN